MATSTSTAAARTRRVLHHVRPRRQRPSEPVALGLCIAVLVAGTLWSIVDNNHQIKVASPTIITVVVGSLVLGRRAMLVLSAAVMVCLAGVFAVHGLNPTQLSASGFVMIVVALLVGVLQAHRRDRLGLRQISAEKVISLIRDRLLVQAGIPEIGDQWSIQVQQAPADGAAIAGDFVSNRLVYDTGRPVLHLAVIDVSGSGIAAGPRALLLSGAVGGLLGSVPADEFLGAANSYLARQQWALGFASAVYLRLELDSGNYEIRAAGHPPVFHFKPGQAPPWRSSLASGTVLGVLPTVFAPPDIDVLRPGEALVLYTDGVVEDRVRDIDAGTMRLRHRVEQLAACGDWNRAARDLIESVPAQHDDDRTVVVIRRRPAAG